MKTNIGGDRLGSGAKMEVTNRHYERSTFDLSHAFRTTMSAGTLVPFYTEIGLPGDKFEIDLNCDVLTHPTIGPLFGSYKVQLDMFQVPIALYNEELYANKINIGMAMKNVLLPTIEVHAKKEEDYSEIEQIEPSCLLSYLGIRGLGQYTGEENYFKREFMGVEYCAYWDIYKNYYANKQEELGAFIHDPETLTPIVSSAFAHNPTTGIDIDDVASSSITFHANLNVAITLVNYDEQMGSIEVDKLIFEISGVQYTADQIFNVRQFSQNAIPLPKIEYAFLKPEWVGETATIKFPAQQIKTQASENGGKPTVAWFALHNIDEMNQDLRRSNGKQITQADIQPYGSILAFDTINLKSAVQSNQEGLAIKTYQSDLFNNWIQTEWIDGENGVNELTRIDTSEGLLMDTLNITQKIYELLNRIAVSGGTYYDWIEATSGHYVKRRVNSPIYEGGLIKELAFQEVISQSATEAGGAQPLGTLAGRGQMTGKHKGGKVYIECDEHSVIMGIISITPRLDYSQGNRWSTNLKTMDDFHKPPLDQIAYQDLITDQMHWGDTFIDDEKITFQSAGKQPAWINYMTRNNTVLGNFAKENQQMFMTLNRKYEIDEDGIADLTTYIDPSKFNHIFADTRLDAQNFWVQVGLGITARRKMSSRQIPNL